MLRSIMTLETYFKVIRVLAALGIISMGLFEATVNPGRLDIFNGAVEGLVLYALWRT